MSPCPCQEQGHLDVDDNVDFKHGEAVDCFAGYLRDGDGSAYFLPTYNKKVWFINFNKEDSNFYQSLIDGGRIIIRKWLGGGEYKKASVAKRDGVLKGIVHVTFGRTEDKKNPYKYLGEFKLVADGNFGDLHVLKRIATRTYLPPPNADE